MIFTTYRMKANEVSKKLVDDIRQRFRHNEKLTITIVSEEQDVANRKVREFLDIEQIFPLKNVPQSPDFNELTDEINL